MSVFTNDNKEFLVGCDCVGGICNCSKLLICYNEGEKEVYLNNIPGAYPITSWSYKIKYVYNILVHGKPPYYDEMVLDKETIDRWIEQLKNISDKL